LNSLGYISFAIMAVACSPLSKSHMDAADAAAQPDGGRTDRGDSGADLPPGSRIVPTGLQPRSSECTQSSDCPPSGSDVPVCSEVIPGGYRVCLYRPPEATHASTEPNQDECDATRPCATGKCYEVLRFSSGLCGLGGAAAYNACRSDACSADSECPNGFCGPPGLSSDSIVRRDWVRQCFQANCQTNDDCTQHAGGVCTLVSESCSHSDTGRLKGLFHPARLACVYPDGCGRESDCPEGSCMVIDGSASCVVR
jgi:hypothetical protein